MGGYVVWVYLLPVGLCPDPHRQEFGQPGPVTPAITGAVANQSHNTFEKYSDYLELLTVHRNYPTLLTSAASGI